MLKKWLAGTAVAAVLAVGAPIPSFAQDQKPQTTTATTTDQTKKAKRVAKRVKHDTKHAVARTRARCKDGTVRRGRTKTTACIGHGGVAGR